MLSLRVAMSLKEIMCIKYPGTASASRILFCRREWGGPGDLSALGLVKKVGSRLTKKTKLPRAKGNKVSSEDSWSCRLRAAGPMPRGRSHNFWEVSQDDIKDFLGTDGLGAGWWTLALYRGSSSSFRKPRHGQGGGWWMVASLKHWVFYCFISKLMTVICTVMC